MTELFESVPSAVPPKPRDRSREGAGKSGASWLKHDLIRRAAGGQASAFRAKNRGRILLIDGNAGDGFGVHDRQLDLFRENLSEATPGLLTRLARQLGNADVLLCEKNRARRTVLADLFPDAVVITDHAQAPEYLCADHAYALWLSDPCGPAQHGVEHMAKVAARIPSDFVIVFNEGWIIEHLGSEKAKQQEKLALHRLRYLPMIPPEWWRDQLCRRRVARTREIIKASERFKYRILVVANHLADAVRSRPPFEVIL